MKLIFLYGPPAVGKFTVAKELSALTNLKLFHNHLTVDVATSIFDHGSNDYLKLLRKMRILILEQAARADIPGLIMTFVYGPAREDAVQQYITAVEKYNGKIYFVRLYCPKKILAERVVNKDRLQYGKIVTVERLNKKLEELEEPFASINQKESLNLNMENLSALEAAKTIIREYQLGNLS